PARQLPAPYGRQRGPPGAPHCLSVGHSQPLSALSGGLSLSAIEYLLCLSGRWGRWAMRPRGNSLTHVDATEQVAPTVHLGQPSLHHVGGVATVAQESQSPGSRVHRWSSAPGSSTPGSRGSAHLGALPLRCVRCAQCARGVPFLAHASASGLTSYS